MITPEDVKQALYELETIFGVPFKDLPIVLLHQETEQTNETENESYKPERKAYTTYEGIYITDNYEPSDLPFIIAHEIGHHIFYDGSLDYKYTAFSLNVQYDYIINNWLRSVSPKLDVANTSINGLHDNQNKSIYERLDQCVPSIETYYSHLSNTQILKTAAQIIHKQTLNSRPNLYRDTLLEEYEYIDSIGYDLDGLWLPIDFYSTMRFVFRWLYQEDIINLTEYYKEQGIKVLHSNESQRIGYTLPKWSRLYYKNPENAMVCAYLFLQNIQNHSNYLKSIRDKMITRCLNMEKRLDDIISAHKRKSKIYKKWVPYYNEQIKKLNERIKSFNINGADYYLTKKITFRLRNKKAAPNLAHFDDESKDVGLKHKRTNFVRCANWCMRQAVKNVDIAIDLYRTLAKYAKDLGLKEDEYDGGNVNSNSDSDNNTGMGHGQGKRRDCVKTTNILKISQLKSIIQNVLKIKNKFETKLRLNKSRPSDYEAQGGFTLGNDPTNAVISELGLLGNEYTKLEFFVKLANNSVFQSTGKESRRLPLIIHIDTSSSMSGKKYELCLGYAFALASILRKERRGVAILLFNDTVKNSIVLDRHSTLNQFLEFFATKFDGGGTNVDESFSTSAKIKMEQGWANAVQIVMTDGEFGMERPKDTGDLYYGLLFRSGNFEMPAQFDDCWDCTERTMRKLAHRL